MEWVPKKPLGQPTHCLPIGSVDQRLACGTVCGARTTASLRRSRAPSRSRPSSASATCTAVSQPQRRRSVAPSVITQRSLPITPRVAIGESDARSERHGIAISPSQKRSHSIYKLEERPKRNSFESFTSEYVLYNFRSSSTNSCNEYNTNTNPLPSA